MAVDRVAAAAIIVGINIALWAVIFVRLLIPSGGARDTATTPTITTPQANIALRSVTVAQVIYYIVLFVWLIDPSLAGPQLFRPRIWSVTVGVVIAAGSLALISWAYVVFKSFRIRAEIDGDHELVTSGPFRLMRHPIYTGVVGAYASTFFIAPRAGFLVAVVLVLVSHDYRARVEEELMVRAFGGRYSDYTTSVRRFVPGLY